MVSREQLVAVGRLWIGTPYVLGGMIRGVGCDCGTLLFQILRHAELIPDEEIGVFQHDWWAHATQEIYVRRMLRHAVKVAETVCSRSIETQPGNIVLCRTPASRVYSHGGLITGWPMVIEAIHPSVQENDVSRSPLWELSNIAIFDPFAGKIATNAGQTPQ